MYVRYSGAWHPIVDEDVVDGLNAAETAETSVDMFDQFDRAGQLVHITAMPTKDPLGPGVSMIADETPVSVTAAAPLTLEVPDLDTDDDLPGAIQAAVENPDLRWWVERRMKALGLTAELPWGSRA
jgi:hypothetical protein